MGKNPQGRMPLLDHFAEFRKRLFKSSAFILAFAVLGWSIYNQILEILSKPVCELRGSKSIAVCGVLYINGVLGPIDL